MKDKIELLKFVFTSNYNNTKGPIIYKTFAGCKAVYNTAFTFINLKRKSKNGST
jgi:hypothetical protein